MTDTRRSEYRIERGDSGWDVIHWDGESEELCMTVETRRAAQEFVRFQRTIDASFDARFGPPRPADEVPERDYYEGESPDC